MDLFDSYRYQLFLGMPAAMPAEHLDQVARYGFRGWRGLTWGYSNVAARYTGLQALHGKLLNRPAYQPIGRLAGLAGQVLGGGQGPEGQFMLGGKPIGMVKINRATTSAIREILERELAENTAVSSYKYMPTTKNVMNVATRAREAAVSYAEKMTLRESVHGMVTGSSAGMTRAIYESLGGNVQAGKIAPVVSKAATRGASAAAFMSLGVKPLLGVWNVLTILGLTYAGAKKLGQASVNTIRTLQHAQMSIPRLDMGGDITAFRTGLALTERQRAVKAIQNNMYNARIALGNEASLVHR